MFAAWINSASRFGCVYQWWFRLIYVVGKMNNETLALMPAAKTTGVTSTGQATATWKILRA